jgi:hypothetical protein
MSAPTPTKRRHRSFLGPQVFQNRAKPYNTEQPVQCSINALLLPLACRLRLSGFRDTPRPLMDCRLERMLKGCLSCENIRGEGSIVILINNIVIFTPSSTLDSVSQDIVAVMHVPRKVTENSHENFRCIRCN